MSVVTSVTQGPHITARVLVHANTVLYPHISIDPFGFSGQSRPVAAAVSGYRSAKDKPPALCGATCTAVCPMLHCKLAAGTICAPPAPHAATSPRDAGQDAVEAPPPPLPVWFMPQPWSVVIGSALSSPRVSLLCLLSLSLLLLCAVQPTDMEPLEQLRVPGGGPDRRGLESKGTAPERSIGSSTRLKRPGIHHSASGLWESSS